MSSLAVGSPDPGFGVSAQTVTLVDLLECFSEQELEKIAMLLEETDELNESSE